MTHRLPKALAAAGVLFLATPAWAQQAYVRSTIAAPWGQTTNEQAMDLAFGVANWDDLRLETVDPLILFSGSYTFVYLEGSDSNATALETFMTANQATVEAWVSSGGTLFINAAPNTGASQNWGFGGVMMNYPASINNAGIASDPAHPIWNGPFLPTAPGGFTGNGFAHATVTGPGLVPQIEDINGNVTMAELAYGSGTVMFGGLTTTNFWTPAAESLNLRANTLDYLANSAGPPIDTDGDGIYDGPDNCDLVPNAGQEDLDADGIGDVCDACPEDFDNDPDGDGVCASPLPIRAAYAYTTNFGGRPWGNTSDGIAMDQAFGAGNWDEIDLSTADVGGLTGSYNVLWLDGGDTGADELEAFLLANLPALETFVGRGGTLYLNAAPNEGTGMSFGFTGAILNYPVFSTDPGMAIDPAHPIWLGPLLPTTTTWTGSSFAHATVIVPGGIPLMQDNLGEIFLSELPFGAGTVIFGGLTPTDFWTPLVETGNLRANLLTYLDSLSVVDGDNCPADNNPSQADEDGDGLGDACDACLGDPINDPDVDGICHIADNCPGVANPTQADADADGNGDACDLCPNDPNNDADGDGVCAGAAGGGGDGAYVHSTVGVPWGNTTDGDAMNLAFGVGSWDVLNFETLDINALTANYGVIWLEGGDSNADELEAFLAANQTAIENWVSGGGSLFLNAAPNEGNGMAFGFGGVDLFYSNASTNPATSLVPTHPAWLGPNLPTATTWTGSSFAHASLTGPFGTALVEDAKSDIYLSELAWGSGTVLFGGLTPTTFWTPQTETTNLRANLLVYLDSLSTAGGGGGTGDNCPNVANPTQTDTDGDGAGDACDVCPNDPLDDGDGDGACDSVDNCPNVSNPTQTDGDGDGDGDACDACPLDANNDIDGDGFCADVDNCPLTPNPTQTDSDGNGIGDACDNVCPGDPLGDIDGDGVCGSVDVCPNVPDPAQADADADGVGDACDLCAADPDNDIDGDGVCGDVDNCPNVSNALQSDADGDGLGNSCDICPLDFDNDADGDGLCAGADLCPADADPTNADTDGDGLGDACETCPLDPANDADGDAICGDVDVCPNVPDPNQADGDADGLGDACDSCAVDPDNDIDADGICGDVDNCPVDMNPGQADADTDGLGDVCDACVDDFDNDIDADGICGDVDNCPADANADQADADGDGDGDVCDPTPNGTTTGTATGTATGTGTGTATGATGTATGATGTGTGTPDDTDGDDKGGCGCSSAPTPAGGLALIPLLGLLALRRRD